MSLIGGCKEIRLHSQLQAFRGVRDLAFPRSENEVVLEVLPFPEDDMPYRREGKCPCRLTATFDSKVGHDIEPQVGK